MKKEAGKTFTYEELKAAVEEHKPAVLFLCQVWLLLLQSLSVFEKSVTVTAASFCMRCASFSASAASLLLLIIACLLPL